MNMNQKGFVNILVIIGAVILVGVAGYFALNNRLTTPTPTPPITNEQPTSTPTLTPTPAATPSPTPKPATNPSKVFSANPTVGRAPLNVNFTVSATDSDASNGIYYTIVFGDGEAAGFSRTSVPTLSHTYSVSGTYTATVTRRTQCSSWECLGPSATIGTSKITVQ